MSQLNVDTIKKADGTGNLSVPAETGTVVTTASPSLGRRNMVLNGSMAVAQRGTSDTVDGGGWDYVIDRFCALGQSSAGVFTYSQDSDAPAGFQKSLKVAVTTADTSLAVGDIYTIRHTIEGYNSAHLDWGTSDAKTVTLSFWVKSSLTGTFGGALNSEGNNRSYAFTYSISAANTWEQKTITIAGDTTGTWGTTNSHGVRVTWGLGVGTTYSGTAGSWAASEYFSATGATSVIGTASATWQITGVQLEVGSVATPFEHRSYGEELALCQRYYQRRGATPAMNGSYYAMIADGMFWDNADTAFINFEFPVDMRATPSLESGGTFRLVGNGTSYTGISTFALQWPTTYGTRINASGSGYPATKNACFLQSNNNSSSYIAFNAEL